MAQAMDFKVMTDEHITNAVSEQLISKGISAVRLIDLLPEGTPDPEVLEYCHTHGYSLITLDEPMRGHINQRTFGGKEHSAYLLGQRTCRVTEVSE